MAEPFELETGIAEWIAALGPDFVILDPAVLAQCQTATFETSAQVLAILRPDSAQQVADCVRIAAGRKIPVYPVSRGRNWGLGSRVPVVNAVIIDLGRLERISACDERFGCLTLEPGVTFEQAYSYLAARGSRWFLPVIGGPSDASVIGNCVERGDRIGPWSQPLGGMVSVQVVLADGSLVETGLERYGETPYASLVGAPAGPWLDGLFTQSNFGIVTRATLWLARHPEVLQILSVTVLKGGLSAFIDALQPLVESLGNGFSSFSLWNGHKINAKQGSPGYREANAWFCHGSLYAPSAPMAAALRDLAVRALEDVSQQLQVLDEGSTPDLRRLASLFLGKPYDDNTRSLYWRKPRPIPERDLDPDRDRCGVIWLCPEVPFDGATLAEVVAACEMVLVGSGFDPILGMTATGARTIRVFVSIFYDRDIGGEDERAMRCHDELADRLRAAGIFPFRLGLHSMQMANQATGPCSELIRRLKAGLDPDGILAPGRYCGPP